MDFTFQVHSETIMSKPSVKFIRGENLTIGNISLGEFKLNKNKSYHGSQVKYTEEGESSRFALHFNEEETVFTTGFGIEPKEGMWFENDEGKNERVKERPEFMSLDDPTKMRVTTCMSNASTTAKKIAAIEKFLYVKSCEAMKLKPTKVDMNSSFRFIGDSSVMKSLPLETTKITAFGPPIGGTRRSLSQMGEYPIDGSHWVTSMTIQPGFVQMKKNGHEWSFRVFWSATQIEFGEEKEKKPELTEEELLERADEMQQQAFKEMMDADPPVTSGAKRPLEEGEIEDSQPAAKKVKA